MYIEIFNWLKRYHSLRSKMHCLKVFYLAAHGYNDSLSPLFVYIVSSVVHKEGFVLFLASSLIYMAITCRLWKTIRKNSLSPEVRDAK